MQASTVTEPGGTEPTEGEPGGSEPGGSEPGGAGDGVAGIDLGAVHPSWRAALAPAAPDLARAVGALARDVAAGGTYLPRAGRVLRAFAQPLEDVRVLVVGQDPYPTPGHAVGLAFAVEPSVRPLPPSLRNLLAERDADTGLAPATTGDLSPWAGRGVLLLNRVLTVAPRTPGAHRRRGWEQVTEQAVRALVARGGPLVAVLWGNEAQSLRPLLGPTPVVASAHPSPLSARRGFFGSRPFSAVDAALAEQGAPPVDWSLP